jgi:hypothetical protein
MPKFKKGSAAAKAYMAKLRASKGKTKVIKTTTKKISGFVKFKAYIKAPLKVREIIDTLDQGGNFVELQKAKTLLNKKGYDVEHDDLGNITKFIKMPAKKVGYRADRTTILTRATPLVKKYREKGYTRPEAIKAANLDVAQKMNSTLFGVKKEPISKHKDTKSHNVNIKVVSGVNGSEYFAKQLNSLLADKNKLETDLMIYKQRVKEKVPFSPFNALHFKRLPAMIKSINIQIRESKKHIK